jgi:hypothetical protein
MAKKMTNKKSQVVKGHQKDLAKVAGQVASKKGIKAGPKGLKPFERSAARVRAERATRKSFK